MTTHSSEPQPVGEAMEANLHAAARLGILRHVFAAAAHDLKSPLNAIALNLALIRDSLPTLVEASGDAAAKLERQQRNLTLAAAEIERLKQMLARLVEQVAPRDTEPALFDLAAVVRDLIELLRPLGMRYKVALDATVEPTVAIAHGSADGVRQAILNVAINGFEAMPRGGRLTLRLAGRAGRAVITVADTGPGLAPDVLPRLFDLHYTTKATAAGIGLHVAKSTIESHGGTIAAANGDEQGAVFTIELPLRA